MENNTRPTLIEKIQDRNDDKSWDEFVFYYKRYIHAVVRKLGVHDPNCEDIVQKVLLTLWEKLPEFEYLPEKCKFRTWLVKIIKFKVGNYFQKANRLENDVHRAALQNINNGKDSFVEPEILKLADIEWRIHISTIAWDNIKNNFNEKSIQCFLMLSEGKTIDETSKQLNLKSNTVYVFKNRVKDKFYAEIRRLERDLG